MAAVSVKRSIQITLSLWRFRRRRRSFCIQNAETSKQWMSVKTNQRMNIQRQTCPRSWVNWGSLLSSTRFNQVISRIHFFGLGSTAFKSNAAPPVKQKQEKKEKNKNKKKTVIINRLKASKRFKMTLAFVVSFFLISLFALRWSCFKV